jgi:nitrite reductase (cytochrome c-552)
MNDQRQMTHDLHSGKSPFHANHGAAGRRLVLGLAALLVVVALVTFGVTALLVTIFEHQQEARVPFVRVAEVNEISTDPEPWGRNWPYQFDTYKRTVDVTQTRYGGSNAMPESKLEESPWLRRLYAGYAFSIDYRERRGHAYMLYDQTITERVTQRQQAGACLHCHASIIPTYRRIGLEAMGKPADTEALGADFQWDAVMRGFDEMSRQPYEAMFAELLRTPDGTPGETRGIFPEVEQPVKEGGQTPPLATAPSDDVHAADYHGGEVHPVSCVDCHDPQTMGIRVTRPGFIRGIAALAESDAPAPHLPSVERWREGNRSAPYDPNRDASRQELRSFVCGQCHVEYYCANKETLFFPWHNGLRVEDIESLYEGHAFPDGTPFYDYAHGETGAPSYKAQHPEFELWSQGIHARSGVSCADCHMPYERQGAMKVSNHWVRSPLLNISASCQTCHNVPEEELLDRVYTIQDRTKALMERAAVSMTDMVDAILEAQAAGISDEQLAEALVLQRKAMWRLDYISSENSMGFHADQEAARILGESIDYSRQAQAMALRLRAPEAPAIDQETEPVIGVTPAERPATEAAGVPGK